jgi:hypothetical protein
MAYPRTVLVSASLAAALFGACAAGAATFDVVRAGPDTVTLMDRAAVETLEGGKLRRAWSVNVQRNLVSGGPQQPGYVRTLNEYDCEAWKIRWRTFSAYSRFGALVMKKDNDDPSWAPAVGDAEAAAGARLVCDGHSTGEVYAAGTVGQVVVALMQAWDAAAPLPPLQPVRPLARPATKRRDKPARRR